MPATTDRSPARVRGMFGRIAGRYDLLNRLLSANLDRGWRRAAGRALPAEPLERVLDLCGGTGDLTLELARTHPIGVVVCCDFCHPMLVRARHKLRGKGLAASCVLLEADALRLPFPGSSFDAVTIAFGVRNFVDPGRGLREIRRILRPAGRLVVLEFSRPRGPLLGRLYRAYLRHVLPRIGDRVAGGGGAYGYLAETIAGFPDAAEMARAIREAGFAACTWRCLSGGIVAVHTALAGAPGRPEAGAGSSPTQQLE